MTASRVGGNESDIWYFALFVFGVALGSLIRVVAYVFPNRTVHKLEDILIGDLK
jgi:hypothetical protein